MNSPRTGSDRLAYRVGSLSLSGLTMTKVILWLAAITIVSFVIGFAILAASGNLPDRHGKSASPFVDGGSLDNTTSFALDGASSGEVRILLGAGDFTLQGGAPAGRLMEATVSSGSSQTQPEYSESLNNSVKTVTMTRKGNPKLFSGHVPDSWEIHMGETVPVDLNVKLGAGDSSLTLGSLDLASLTFSNGAGNTRIDIRDYRGGPYHAEIHNGVGDLTLRIDRDSNTRIHMQQGVGDVAAKGMVQTDETYTTAGFNPALPVNEMAITQGVGSIQLEAE